MRNSRVRLLFLVLVITVAISARAGETAARVGSEGTPTFTLDQAVLTALQQNPAILRARQEIERTKGLYIQLRAAILPQISGTGQYQDLDPHLLSSGAGSGGTGFSGISGTTRSYTVTIQATQVVFAGGRIVSQIRSANFQRDASYYAFRDVIDQTVSTTKQEFYQVVLNRALIGVQEESVRLLKSQLQDQQNRFEAGTVPRFNVLQAQVALSNQLPQLITAQNTYRISQLTLARTLGLDFNPARGTGAPLEVVGELVYVPSQYNLADSIATAKENRPFLKEQKATVLSNRAQVGVARSGFFPQLNASIGEEGRSSVFSDKLSDIRAGYVFQGTGSWAVWDWGATYGSFKQAKAVLEESKITYDDTVRQVEVDVQTAYANLEQGRQLIQSQIKNVEEATEALRLAQARLDAGAGTQLDVLDARVQLTTAQSTQLQALYTYNAALAEFERVTGTEVVYSSRLDEPRTRRKLRTDANPTPGAKPTPLPLNPSSGTRTTSERSLGK